MPDETNDRALEQGKPELSDEELKEAAGGSYQIPALDASSKMPSIPQLSPKSKIVDNLDGHGALSNPIKKLLP